MNDETQINKDEQNSELDELEATKKERDEYLDGWKRAKADFINYRQEEMDRTKKMGGIIKEMIIGDVLPVLDSFELGIASVPDEQSKKGMELIKMQLEEMARRHGLEKIGVSPGDMFNPAFHEAVGEKESEYPEGTIAEEFGKGYMIDGRVLRPTRVKISIHKNKEENK